MANFVKKYTKEELIQRGKHLIVANGSILATEDGNFFNNNEVGKTHAEGHVRTEKLSSPILLEKQDLNPKKEVKPEVIIKKEEPIKSVEESKKETEKPKKQTSKNKK